MLTTEHQCPECGSIDLLLVSQYIVQCQSCGFEDMEDSFLPSGLVAELMEDATYLDHADESFADEPDAWDYGEDW